MLDFAGNIERIRMISRIVNTVAQMHEEARDKNELSREGYKRNPFLISGHGFEFTFSKQIVEIEKIFDRLEVEFYPTWQEASKAAQKLGIKNGSEYKTRYKEDPRLPSRLYDAYKDFPGYTIFLSNQRDFYPTWQEASRAAINFRHQE